MCACDRRKRKGIVPSPDFEGLGVSRPWRAKDSMQFPAHGGPEPSHSADAQEILWARCEFSSCLAGIPGSEALLRAGARPKPPVSRCVGSFKLFRARQTHARTCQNKWQDAIGHSIFQDPM